MSLDFTRLFMMVSLLLSVIFFFVSLTGFTNPQMFKRKTSLKIPNRFLLLFIFLIISIGFLLAAVGLFATLLHKRP
ncbi:hypothetical protein [Chryseobacterium herbae]|uniref:DUF1146 domain-containing protein n=1 Tax=Chryseobacterium herbae TaxID=2976476 RepID=A0ABT2IYL1_9FLAO|nr:hypothetical protein [Chryseobacterium sp. pc1-10]MCT2563933.1 hypothetical protein [Chryseobacterium sp. pc1-10]